MNQPQTPKCPDVKRLGELTKLLRDEITPPGSEIEEQWNKITSEVIDALQWLETFLSNRRLYHKKQQIKRQVMKRLLEERTDEINKLTDEALFTHVSNQEPEDDDLITVLDNLTEEEKNHVR